MLGFLLLTKRDVGTIVFDESFLIFIIHARNCGIPPLVRDYRKKQRSLGYTPEFSTNFGRDPTHKIRRLSCHCVTGILNTRNTHATGASACSDQVMKETCRRTLIMFQWYWCGILDRNQHQEALRHLRWHKLLDMYTGSCWEVTSFDFFSILWNSFGYDRSPHRIAVFRGTLGGTLVVVPLLLHLKSQLSRFYSDGI